MHTVSGFGANTTQSQRRQRKQTNIQNVQLTLKHTCKIQTTFDNFACKVAETVYAIFIDSENKKLTQIVGALD